MPMWLKFLLIAILVTMLAERIESKPALTSAEILATAVPIISKNADASSSEEYYVSMENELNLDADEENQLSHMLAEVIDPAFTVLEALSQTFVKMNKDLESPSKMLVDEPWVKQLIFGSTVFIAVLLLATLTYTMFWENVRAILMDLYDWATTAKKEEGAIYFTAPRRRDRPVS